MKEGLLALIIGGLIIVFVMQIDLFFPNPEGDIIPGDDGIRFDIPFEKGSSEGAPITLVEFVDYECPYCRANHPEIKTILEEYGSTINYVVKPFPNVNAHPNALGAAMAFDCAKKTHSADQNTWMMFHNELFEGELSYNRYLEIANTLDLDSVAFQYCLGDNETKARIAYEVQDGQGIVRGTPTYFLNGLKLEGQQTADYLRVLIEQELLNVPNN